MVSTFLYTCTCRSKRLSFRLTDLSLSNQNHDIDQIVNYDTSLKMGR